MGDFDFDEFDTNNTNIIDTIDTINTIDTSDTVDTSVDILKQIDKKIILKYMKEVKTSRTYIFGLHNYIQTKDKITDFVKNIKKSLGTSVIEKKDTDGNMVYGFAGDHMKYINELLIKKNICLQSDIKK